jgi:hypothetical protein
LDEIGSNSLCLGWNCIKISLPWMKLDQTFFCLGWNWIKLSFALDEIGSNFLCFGWNWIKLSLLWMKLDQTFFDLVSSRTHLSLHHVWMQRWLYSERNMMHIHYGQNKPTASSTQWWMVGGQEILNTFPLGSSSPAN